MFIGLSNFNSGQIMRIIFFLSIFLILSSLFGHSAESKGYRFIEKFFEEGKITYEEMLLNKFYYIFDKQKLKPEFKFENDPPVKCATSLIIEYQKNKTNLSELAIRQIENYLNPQKLMTPTAFTYDSPGGKFRLTYETTGPNAVPTTDNNGNGVPDFVEWVASYFDYSWNYEIDTLGFLPPPIGTGKYHIGFEEMGAYGYTTVVSGQLTRIVMHRNFIGFPPNNDPEGNQKGAAKVTAAHEFKHATQIMYNYWNEPSWYIELDATWMEDMAYDYVNDYYNYIFSSGSPFTSPGQSLDAGDGYEDCNWMIYLSERFDIQINKIIWQRRQSNPAENMFSTFNYILSNFYSSNFQSAFREYIVWNFLTSTRLTTTHPGYGEATNYPLAALCNTVSSFPFNGSNCSITKYAANFIRVNPISNSNSLSISFNGANSPHVFKVTVVTRKTSGLVESFEIPLDGNNDGTFLVPVPNNQLSYLGLCVAIVSGNTGPTFTYSITEQTSYSTSVNYNSGWNILSIPINLSNMNFENIFPEAASFAYYFDNGYQVASTAELGKGYWLKFNSAVSKNLIGTPQTSVTINVKSGWNIIGPLHQNIPTTSISTNPPGIISSLFYSYNNGYQTATNLEKGKGYWVKVSSNGTMTIPSFLAKAESNVDITDVLNNLSKISVIDSKGHMGELYISKITLNIPSDLPPVPPSNIFDVRFSDNQLIKSLAEREFLIEINGAEYPVMLRFENVDYPISIVNPVTEEKLNSEQLDELILTDQSINKIKLVVETLPQEFKLFQNFPNPFNPITNINFSLDKPGIISLKIYNSLGEEVGELINEKLESGFHTVKFDASNLPGGIYFARLVHSNRSQTIKLVLLK